MIKFDLKQSQVSPINFEDLQVGETFLVSTEDNAWIGMKVADLCDYEPKYYIMDLSEYTGELYDDWESSDYKIIRTLDLKITEE